MKKIMRNFKIIICSLVAMILPLCLIGCSNDNDNTDTKTFAGIAIYQKIEDNLNWSKFNSKPNSVNNIISTKNNKIEINENPTLLFIVYTQNEITEHTTDEDFISNTTRDKVKLEDSSLSFRIERIVEDTDILIYHIYKLSNGDYYFEYVETKNNLKETTKTFEINFSHKAFSKIKLTLETNLTINDEY